MQLNNMRGVDAVNQLTDQPAFTNQLINYVLFLADNTLILAHRNSEWCGHGPALELDIAITNIALDLLGQARNFYQYAAELINKNSEGGLNVEHVTEDTLAYWRDAGDFKNCLLVEQPNGDWGVTILRQFFFSTYQYYLYQQLQHSNDERIAAIAGKALKEVTYHVRWSSEWVIRLGIGTEESHRRMLNAFNILKDHTAEFFVPTNYETEAAQKGYGTDIALLKPLWMAKVNEVLLHATLPEISLTDKFDPSFFGKEGKHTPHLETLLTEMQVLQRTYPGANW